MDLPIEILLIEDNSGDARLIGEMLADSKISFDVKCVGSLSQGLDRLNTDRVDVVFLDLGLPDSQGLDALRQVHRHGRRIPVVVLTGLDDEALAIEAVQAGAQDYLVKGQISANILSHSVRYAIERKRVEQELQESEERFRSVSETASDAIILATSDGRVVSLNPAAEALFGYPSDEAVGRSLTLFMPERLQAEHERGLRRFIETGERKIIGNIVEVVGRRRDGAEFPVEISLAVWKARDGMFFTAILRDITTRTAVEQLRRDLVRMLSHDIKNPLGAVLGFVEILREDLRAGRDPKEAIDTIESSAQAALALAVNFLEADRIESSFLRLHRVPTSLNEVVEHVARHQAAQARLKQVEIQRHLLASLPQLDLDTVMIDRVVANLLNNAIKFSPRGGVVEILTGRRDNLVTVSIRDQGPGIAAEDFPKLFERYNRGAGSRTDSTGLGLYIVKVFTEAHGGSLSVHCPLDGGTLFEVSIPDTSRSEPT